MVNWDAYLESLRKKYAQWWQAYTLTDVVGQCQAELSPLLNLRVQTFQTAKEEQDEAQEKAVAQWLSASTDDGDSNICQDAAYVLGKIYSSEALLTDLYELLQTHEQINLLDTIAAIQ